MKDRLKHLIDDLGIDIILTEAEKQHIIAKEMLEDHNNET